MNIETISNNEIIKNKYIKDLNEIMYSLQIRSQKIPLLIRQSQYIKESLQYILLHGKDTDKDRLLITEYLKEIIKGIADYDHENKQIQIEFNQTQLQIKQLDRNDYNRFLSQAKNEIERLKTFLKLK